MLGPIYRRTAGVSLRVRRGDPARGAGQRGAADAGSLADWFPDGDPFGRDALLDAAELLGVDPDHGVQLSTHALREIVAEGFAEGRLRVDRLPDHFPVFRASEPAEEKQDDKKTEKKTFVAIQLVDDADPSRPVPFKRYRIELPDGSSREGLLDQHGRALVDGIDEGECKVSFPDFDAKAWKKG